MFQLTAPTHVKLKNINIRTETHGKAKVPAIDLDFILEGSNENLSLLNAGLCGSFYYDPDAESGQDRVDGVEPVGLRKLRFPKLGALSWDETTEDMDLKVIWGTGDERSNIEFGGGKTTIKKIEPKEGGTCPIAFKFATASIPDGALDKLRSKLEQVVEITLVHNAQLRQDAIDGTGQMFSDEHPLFDGQPQDATGAFLEQHGDDVDGPRTSDDPQPEAEPALAGDMDGFEEGATKAVRSRRARAAS